VLLTQYLYLLPTFCLNLTFIGPCIANIISGSNQQDATFLKFIHFCKVLYMYQTVFPSIIRSTKLHIQRQVFVTPLLHLVLAAGSSNGRKTRLKHVERLTERNKFQKRCILLAVLCECIQILFI